MREPDRGDMETVLRLYDLRRESEMRKARSFVMGFMPKTFDEFKAALDFAHPENAHFRQVVSYWEMAADFALRGLLHPEMFAAHCGEGIVTYLKCEPYLERVRAEMNPRFLANLAKLIKEHDVVAQRAQMMREMMARWMAAQKR